MALSEKQRKIKAAFEKDNAYSVIVFRPAYATVPNGDIFDLGYRKFVGSIRYQEQTYDIYTDDVGRLCALYQRKENASYPIPGEIYIVNNFYYVTHAALSKYEEILLDDDMGKLGRLLREENRPTYQWQPVVL